MRKIQNYLLKDAKIFVGLEDSKRTWKICVRAHGHTIKECSMPANYDNLRNFFKKSFPECKIHVIYEAGFRGFGLHDRLIDDGYKCTVTPPHTLVEEKCNRQKTDRKDARRLAKDLENDDYKTCWVPDVELREDRQISRTYGQIQRDIVRVKNRIRRAIEFHGIESHFVGKWSDRVYRNVMNILQKGGISDSLLYSMGVYVEQLNHLRDYKKDLIKRLRSLAKNARYIKTVELFKSVPGIGIFTAIRLVLELGDLDRFKKKSQIVDFLGLCPGEYSTGENERKGHITKQGNRGIRSWLIEAAWVALRKDPVLFNKFIRITRNTGGSKKKAIVAIARTLAIRLRAIFMTQTEYVLGVIE